ncbi:unnamed protein product, partial [Ceratitis capitata]
MAALLSEYIKQMKHEATYHNIAAIKRKYYTRGLTKVRCTISLPFKRKCKITEDSLDQIPQPTQTEIHHSLFLNGSQTPDRTFFRRGRFPGRSNKSSTDDVIVALVMSKIDEAPQLTQEMIANELVLNTTAAPLILNTHLISTKKSAGL